jgi:hypothetical protein
MFQCTNCVNFEKGIQKSLKSKKNATKPAANKAKTSSDVSKSKSEQEDFRCDVCRDVLFQCRECADLEKAVKKSKNDLAKAAANLAQHSSDVSKQKKFLTLIKRRYQVKAIARDGDCLFKSIMVHQERFLRQKMNVQQVRDAVAAQLLSEMTENGCISGQTYEFFSKNAEGVFVLSDSFESYRGEAKQAAKKRKKKGLPDPPPPTLEEYATKIQGTLFGGDLETLLLANLYDLTINVFSWQFYDGDRTFSPQVFGSGSRTVSIVFDQDFSRDDGAADHYFLILHQKFEKWEAYMRNMPKWNRDIAICTSKGGRGIKALRNFKKGDVLLYYDGHRIDDKGHLAIERESVSILCSTHGVPSCLPHFERTHAVCLGRTHCTGLLIDGYPLTLANFDHVEIVGRGALANSGTPKESNMIMVWVEAPDLPPDFVDHLRNCEAFLVASRDITCVDVYVVTRCQVIFLAVPVKNYSGITHCIIVLASVLQTRCMTCPLCRLRHQCLLQFHQMMKMC